jgi:DNA-binding MarR family transcriptional regulator
MQNLSTYKLIERIGMLLRAEERKRFATLGLQPIHIQVLSFLDICNSYSNTPASVTEYFGLTKGTVSQTLQVLERKGYLQKQLDEEDGRIIHLILTDQGRQLCAEFNPEDFMVVAERSVMANNFTSLYEALAAMLTSLQKAYQVKSFGACNSCVNFDVEDEHFLCSITRLPVFQAETHKICREHIAVPTQHYFSYSGERHV